MEGPCGWRRRISSISAVGAAAVGLCEGASGGCNMVEITFPGTLLLHEKFQVKSHVAYHFPVQSKNILQGGVGGA